MTAHALGRSSATTRPAAPGRLNVRPGRAGLYLLTALLAVIFTAPFFFTISSSLKTVTELHVFPPTLVPAVPQFSNYARVFKVVPYGTFYLNTVIIAGTATIGNVLCA